MKSENDITDNILVKKPRRPETKMPKQATFDAARVPS